jgi:drug/metabolite transporter (DMT)-like permease
VSRSSLLRLCLLGFIWGNSFLLIKVAIEGLSPTQVVLGRLGAGAAVLVVAMLARRERPPRRLAVWGHLVVMAVVANLVPFFLFAWGEERISSGRAGVLNATTPLATLLLALALLPQERPTAAKVGGLGLGFAGVVVLVAPWAGGRGAEPVAGQLACLGAAVSYGVAFVYTRRFLHDVGLSPLVLATCQLAAGTVLLGAAAPLLASDPVSLGPRVAAAVLLLGGFGTGVAYLLYYGLVRDAGPTSASMVTYLIPVAAVLLGVVVLHEHVTWNLFAGAAVVIAGVALAEGRLRPGRRPWQRPRARYAEAAGSTSRPEAGGRRAAS